jgi:mannose-6-phosphate isomerase
MKFYPLQFQPIFKDRIWGGTKLKTVLNKPITSSITGESWELSTVDGDVSVIANGEFAGKSLTAFIDAFPNEVLGTKVFKIFGKQFPLLFKDLSIQVHPNDQLASARHNSFGKTEMWYVLQADAGSSIIIGFKKDSNSAEYIENLNGKTLLSLLDTIPVEVGDVFFLETGTVHAIGAGLLIAEIQQTSDITYRLYDFDRVDADGNTRALHIDLALDAINYDKIDAKKSYQKHENTSNEMVDCNYFTTNYIPLSGTMKFEKDGRSFHVYMCTEGDFTITQENVPYHYKKGDTILMPAAISIFEFTGNASLLEIYIK